MSTHKKTRSNQDKLTGFRRIEKFHPFKTLLFFGLVGSTLLFMSMLFLYFVSVSRDGTPLNFELPKSFSVSTVFLLLSSFSVSGAASAFRNDSLGNLKLSLSLTMVFGTLFCFSQFYGLRSLIDENFFNSSNVGIAYLYVISGMHLLHVAGGMIYLSVISYRVFSNNGDLVKSLLYFSDEYQLTRLQLTTIYWHFIDALWILLYFMFLFSY